MSEIQLVPTQDDSNRFSEQIRLLRNTESWKVDGFVNDVKTLGELILSGELVIVGTNVAANKDDSIAVAQQECINFSIIGTGVVIDADMETEAGKQTDETPEDVETTKIDNSLIVDSNISGSRIISSVVTGSTVVNSGISNSAIDFSDVTGSTLEKSDIMNQSVTVSGLLMASITASSRTPSFRGEIVDSTLRFLQARGSNFRKVNWNQETPTQELLARKIEDRDVVISSDLNNVIAYLTHMSHVGASDSKFGGYDSKVGRTTRGGNLWYIDFASKSEVYDCYGGGADSFPTPSLSGVHNKSDFSVSCVNGNMQVHITKRHPV